MNCPHADLNFWPTPGREIAFRCDSCGITVGIVPLPEWQGLDPQGMYDRARSLALAMIRARDAALEETVKPASIEPDRRGHQHQAITCRPESTGITGQQEGRLTYFARCECGWTSEIFYADENGQREAREAGITHWSAPDLDDIDTLVARWASE